MNKTFLSIEMDFNSNLFNSGTTAEMTQERVLSEGTLTVSRNGRRLNVVLITACVNDTWRHGIDYSGTIHAMVFELSRKRSYMYFTVNQSKYYK